MKSLVFIDSLKHIWSTAYDTKLSATFSNDYTIVDIVLLNVHHYMMMD